MKPLLQNKDIAGKSIGLWKATHTPAGSIIWIKPKRIWGKEHRIGVYATPHYDKPNVVSVDVVKLNELTDNITLSTSFTLKGEYLDSDLKIYLVQMEVILNLLK